MYPYGMKKWICIILGLWAQQLAAQDTIMLKNVEILGSAPAFGQGFEVDSIFSKYFKHQREQLRFISPINLRTYGPAGISTIQNRGAGNNQIQTLWNGIPIQNAFLGQTDVALLNQSGLNLSFKNFDAQSNAIGGALAIQNQQSNINEISLALGYNTIQNLNTQININQVMPNASVFSMSLNGNEQKNAFKYFNPYQEKVIQQHSDISQQSLLASWWLNSSSKWKNSIHVWLSNSARNIPPSKFQKINQAVLKDESYRVQSLNQVQINSSQNLKLKAAFDRQILAYKDTSKDINSLAVFNRFFLSETYLIEWSKYHSTQIDYQQHLIQYQNSEFEDSTSQYALKNSVAIQQSFNTGKVMQHQIQFRGDFYNYYQLNRPNRLVKNGIYSLHFKQNLLSRLQLNLAYNQKEPSLNDLLWFPGGNINLLPERGFKYELSLEKNLKSHSIGLNLYHQNIHDKIQWQPSSGFWTPRNLKAVQMQGAELIVHAQYVLNKIKLRHQSIVTYNKAIQTASNIVGDQSIGMQLVYVPIFQFKHIQHYEYNGFTLFANALFESARFTTSDNYNFLKAYTILNAGLHKRISGKKLDYQVGIDVQNLLNANYELVQAYAMPLRYYEFTFKINIK
jgi:vitamin B12 transporter